MIGGIPLPSLTSMAMGAAFKALFKGVGKVIGAIRKGVSKGAGKGAARAAGELADQAASKPSKIRALLDKFRKKPPARPAVSTLPLAAHQQVDDLLNKGKIVINDGGDAAFRQAVKDDLVRIANNKVGTQTLDDIAKGPHPITIEKYDKTVPYFGKKPGHYGPHAAKGPGYNVPGTGSPTTVRYDPSEIRPGSPPDTTLHHELAHGRNNSLGQNMSDVKNPAGQGPVEGFFWRDKWTNLEEHDVITKYDNPYRAAEGLPLRKGHNHLPR
jgi:hypothetical protein